MKVGDVVRCKRTIYNGGDLSIMGDIVPGHLAIISEIVEEEPELIIKFRNIWSTNPNHIGFIAEYWEPLNKVELKLNLKYIKS